MAVSVRITIHCDTAEELREILRREDLDLNCGGPKQTPIGEWVVEAYAPQRVATRLRRAGVRVETERGFEKRMSSRRTDITDGDRFFGGHIPPRGIGRKE